MVYIMISQIKGTIESKENIGVVIMTPGGVGYEIALAPMHVAKIKIGDEVELSTYLRVTDSAMDLYGFQSRDEREFFMMLLSVSGVGPKSAMNVLSLGSMDDIKNAISRGDAKYLSAVKGMGAKTAERLCVELKTKVQGSGFRVQGASEPGGQILSEVIDGLVALGYSKEEARGAVGGVETEGKTTEEVMKEVLRKKA